MERHPSEFERPARPGDLTPFILELMRGQHLGRRDAERAFEELVSGQSHPAELGAFLALLAQRVPDPEEIAGAAGVMRRHVDALEHSIPKERLLDTAGTGGAPKTFNCSTAASIVAAAAGVPVAKAGNRSRTGRGSAEVLMALGVDVDAPRERQRRCLEEAGICFCFAIHHHPAARHAIPVRKALGFPTIFNLLGPLVNPAGARRQVMGVYKPEFLRPVGQALASLGAVRGLVIHGAGGLDEVSTAGPTRVVDVGPHGVREYEVTPAQVGVSEADPRGIGLEDPEGAAQLLRDLFAGRGPEVAKGMLLLNAAAALVAGGVAEDFPAGAELARKTIASGAAAATLEKLARLSHA